MSRPEAIGSPPVSDEVEPAYGRLGPYCTLASGDVCDTVIVPARVFVRRAVIE
jgi:hypothetical protein